MPEYNVPSRERINGSEIAVRCVIIIIIIMVISNHNNTMTNDRHAVAGPPSYATVLLPTRRAVRTAFPRTGEKHKQIIKYVGTYLRGEMKKIIIIIKNTRRRRKRSRKGRGGEEKRITVANNNNRKNKKQRYRPFCCPRSFVHPPPRAHRSRAICTGPLGVRAPSVRQMADAESPRPR